MKTATTLQFRNAVRLVTETLGGTVYQSYTDAPNYEYHKPKRYVGFAVRGVASETVAARAESILNTLGLTANTRSKPRKPEYYSNYVRGTCVTG